MLEFLLPSSNSPGKKASNKHMKNPISTTNITGFFTIYFGFSFKKAPFMDDFNISFVTNFVFLFLLITPPIRSTTLLLVLMQEPARKLMQKIYKQQ